MVVSEHEPKPVARQWCAHDSNGQITAWYPEGYGDEAGWISLSERHPGSAKVEYRDIYPASDITALQEEVAYWRTEAAGEAAKVSRRDNQLATAEARANAAEQRLREAVKVLEPFASLEPSLALDPKDDDREVNNAVFDELPKWGHLRAARAFIKEAGE